MFDQGEFGSRLELAEVDLIHEGANEEDAAASAAHEVFGSERVGQMFPINALSLVSDGENEGFAVVFKTGCDLFGGVVIVAVQYCVYGGLSNGHGNAEALFFVEAGLTGQFIRGGFDLADALHCGRQRKAQFPRLRIAHRLRLRLYGEWQSPALPREDRVMFSKR